MGGLFILCAVLQELMSKNTLKITCYKEQISDKPSEQPIFKHLS